MKSHSLKQSTALDRSHYVLLNGLTHTHTRVFMNETHVLRPHTVCSRWSCVSRAHTHAFKTLAFVHCRQQAQFAFQLRSVAYPK